MGSLGNEHLERISRLVSQPWAHLSLSGIAAATKGYDGEEIEPISDSLPQLQQARIQHAKGRFYDFHDDKSSLDNRSEFLTAAHEEYLRTITDAKKQQDIPTIINTYCYLAVLAADKGNHRGIQESYLQQAYRLTPEDPQRLIDVFLNLLEDWVQDIQDYNREIQQDRNNKQKDLNENRRLRDLMCKYFLDFIKKQYPNWTLVTTQYQLWMQITEIAPSRYTREGAHKALQSLQTQSAEFSQNNELQAALEITRRQFGFSAKDIDLPLMVTSLDAVRERRRKA